MELYKIGVITKTQGLKGEVRAKIIQNENNLIKNNSDIYLNEDKYLVKKITDRNTFVVLKIEGVNSIDEAEKLINKDLFLEKSDALLGEDEFLVKDVIGFNVVDENNNILGTIKDINDYGAGDVYTVLDSDNKTFMFVNSRDVIAEFDFENNKLVVNSKILSEIGVFS